MNKFFLIIIFAVFSPAVYCQSEYNSDWEKFLKAEIVNESNLSRIDEPVFFCLKDMKKNYPDFNENNFAVLCLEKEIPSQAVDWNGDGLEDAIMAAFDFLPHEKKEVTIYYNTGDVSERVYQKRTQAVLYKKKDFELKNGYYTGGIFRPETKVKVPAGHFAHDALFKTEGPAWESDKIAYRLYLDSRNKNDIFGKKIDSMVIHSVGINDLVSDGKESYTSMAGWGMDIFKVGESLGLGSISMRIDSKNYFVAETDSVVCSIPENGPVYSSVKTDYSGWRVDNKKYDLCSNLSITAGSRLTKVNLMVDGEPENICTGLPKHENTEFMISNNDSKEGWGFIALYGRQSLSGDDLGIAVFYSKTNLIYQGEDELNYYVLLKPDNGKLSYYFAAAWQSEPDGIRTIDEFAAYINDVVEKLNNPVKVLID